MRFAYYDKLTRSQKKIYDESDRIASVTLNRPLIHRERSASLASVLATGERLATERRAQALCDGLTEALGVPALEVGVMERRPSWRTGELHGLYESDSPGRYKISLWMRTARRAQVVKFKTFLRTFVHELCHHLDYHRFRLRDSFHTAGFYRRESSLMRQLLPDEPAPKRAAPSRLAQSSNQGIQ